MTTTDTKAAALETLKQLAKARAAYIRGGSTSFDTTHQPQIAQALRISGTTDDEWGRLCRVVETEESAQWADYLKRERR